MRTLAVALAAAVAISCAGPGAPARDPLAGRYKAGSGDSGLPLARALLERFAASHAGMSWEVQDFGSTPTVALVSQGDLHLGFVSRALTTEEEITVRAYGLGYVGQAFVVNAANPVRGLSSDQLRGIFTGKVRDWSEVGGPTMPIRVFTRSTSSSTAAAMGAFLFGGDLPRPPGAIEAPDADEMAHLVATVSGGIGIITASPAFFADADLKALEVDGVAPTPAAVASARYPIRRPVYLVYRVDPVRLNAVVPAFIDFVRSDEGQRILSRY